MQLAAVTPTPMPVMPTTGPKDWVGVPLATFEWNERGVAPTPAFAKSTFHKLDDVTSVEAALSSAARWSNQTAPSEAVGVLQAKDGAFYIAKLGRRNGDEGYGYYFPSNDHQLRVTSVTPHVDALKAIVGGTSWIKFDQQPGETPQPVTVPQS